MQKVLHSLNSDPDALEAEGAKGMQWMSAIRKEVGIPMPDLDNKVPGSPKEVPRSSKPVPGTGRSGT